MARDDHYSRFIRSVQEGGRAMVTVVGAGLLVPVLLPQFRVAQRRAVALYSVSPLDLLLRRFSRLDVKKRSISPRVLARTVAVLEWLYPLPSGFNTCLFRSLVRFQLVNDLTTECVVFNLGLPATGQGAGHAWVTVGGEFFPRNEQTVYRCTYRFVVEPQLDARIGP